MYFPRAGALGAVRETARFLRSVESSKSGVWIPGENHGGQSANELAVPRVPPAVARCLTRYLEANYLGVPTILRFRVFSWNCASEDRQLHVVADRKFDR